MRLNRQNRPTRLRALIGLTILLAALALSNVYSTVQAASTNPVQSVTQLHQVIDPAIGARLLADAQTKPVRLIVGVKGSFQTEGAMRNGAQIAQQRSAIQQAQNSLIAKLGSYKVTIIHSFETIPYILLSAEDAAALQYLMASPDVASISEDKAVPPIDTGSNHYIGADHAFSEGYDGHGGLTGSSRWMVGILDTGVQTSHPFFAGRIYAESCYSTTNASANATSLCPGGVDGPGVGKGVNCNLAIYGCEHGTHVAGIAAGQNYSGGPGFNGVAPYAGIIPVQVFSQFTDGGAGGNPCAGNGIPSPCALTYYSDQMLALEYIYSLTSNGAGPYYHDIAAVNLSLGGGGFSSTCDTYVSGYTADVNNLKGQYTATVAAAGNSGSNSQISFPACISTAVSVGATDDHNNIASYSNHASFMTLYAPGDNIYSSVPNSTFAFLSGTSMAAPHVAGAFAVLSTRFPSYSTDQYITLMTNTGYPTFTGVSYSNPRLQLDSAASVPIGIGLLSPPGGQFYLRNTDTSGNANYLFSFGPAPSSLTPLAGDWTGKGYRSVGLYDPGSGFFYLKNANSAGNADIIFSYGPGGAGLIPIVGDWTGKGYDSIGLYDPGSAFFYLHNCNAATCGTSDIVFSFGPPSANLTPIVGDWTWSGFDTVGLYSQQNAFFYLKYSNSGGPADVAFQYGPATGNGGPPATPLIGKWIGGGTSTIGVYVPANAYFYLKNFNGAGNADEQFQFGPGPNAGWKVIAGQWGIFGSSGPIAEPGPRSGDKFAARDIPVASNVAGSIGFVSNRDGAWNLYVLHGSESNLQRLAALGTNPLESRPAWSPDGKQVAFVSNKDGSPALYVMNADGSNLKRLTFNKVLNYQPSWSADGKQLVFASNLGNSTNLYVMNADGNNVQQLTHSLNELNEQANWSPDGKQIVYATGKGTLDIAVMAADGKTSSILTRNGQQPIWSPDGKQIAFVSTRDGNAQLYAMNADGSNIRRLTNDRAQDEMPTWSPDGKQIAFVSTRDGNAQLYVMNADGSNVFRLTNNAAQDKLPVWLP